VAERRNETPERERKEAERRESVSMKGTQMERSAGRETQKVRLMCRKPVSEREQKE